MSFCRNPTYMTYTRWCVQSRAMAMDAQDNRQTAHLGSREGEAPQKCSHWRR